MPRGKVSGPDPRWAGAQPFEEDGPPPPPSVISLINAPPGRSEFTAPPPVDQPVPAFLRGSGGGTPQPDPIQVTRKEPTETTDVGNSGGGKLEIPPIELDGSPLDTASMARIGAPMPPTQPFPADSQGRREAYVPPGFRRGEGDVPEPPPGPQASQGIPELLARPPAAVARRQASKPKMAAVVAPGQAQTPSQPVLQDQGNSTSPDFDAYVAQRAKDIADLKAAQGTADQARRWQDIANGFVRAGDAVARRKTDETALQQRLDNTQQPVRNVLQQQEAGRKATEEAAAQTSLSGKMWEQRMAAQDADPGSARSQNTQAFLAKTGLFPPGAEKFVSRADFEHAVQAGAQGLHALALKAQIAHQNAELALGKGKLDEETRNHNLEHEDRQFRMFHDVPTQSQNELDALLGSGRSLKDLIDAHDKAGLGDKIGSYFGMGDYDATKRAAGPEVAKGDARGRVNPTGASRATAGLPNFNPGSRKALVERFTNNQRDALAKLREMETNPRLLRETVAEKRRQYDEIYGGNGGSAGAAIPAHPEDSEAVAWARSNPGAAGAAQILKLNGIE